jgi:hypothetical protein
MQLSDSVNRSLSRLFFSRSLPKFTQIWDFWFKNKPSGNPVHAPFQENPCVNTCDELGAAERQEAERLARLAEEGLKVKADLIQRGKELK